MSDVNMLLEAAHAREGDVVQDDSNTCVEMRVFLNLECIKSKGLIPDNNKDSEAEVAEWFGGWCVSDSPQEATRVFEKDEDMQSFFYRAISNQITVVGVQEFPYQKKTIEREYWIWDQAKLDEYVVLHVHFAGEWHHDPAVRAGRLQLVTSVNLRHSVSADQSTAATWYRKCQQMDAWREMDKNIVQELPRPWRWADTYSSLPAIAIKGIMIMASKACIVTRCLTMATSASSQLSVRTSEGKNLALIMAVGDYLHLRKLPNAVGDGETLKATLEKLAPAWEVDLLRDPTKAQAKIGLSNFIDKCSDVKGAVMITLIGHGVEAAGQSYSHFFLRDSNLSHGCNINTEEFINECMDTSEICCRLAIARSKRSYPPTIMVFDCCRTDLKVTTGCSSAPKLARPAVPTEFENLYQIYSTNAGNTASDGTAGSNSPFMALFHKLIQTPGLDIVELMREVTGKLKHVQLAKISLLSSQKFYFVPRPASPQPLLSDASALKKRRKEEDIQDTKVNLDLFACILSVHAENIFMSADFF
jgi:hypothetical protein